MIVISETQFSLSGHFESAETARFFLQAPLRNYQQWIDLKAKHSDWKDQDVLVIFSDETELFQYDLSHFITSNVGACAGLILCDRDNQKSNKAFGDFWPLSLRTITPRTAPAVGKVLKMACWFKPAGVDKVFDPSKNPRAQMLYPLVRTKTGPVLFLDRDGVLIEDVGYLDSLSQIELKHSVVQELKKLQQRGVDLVVVTNQSGVARGKFDLKFVNETHLYLAEKLLEAGVTIKKWYTSPYHPDGIVSEFTGHSLCRKPFPGLVMEAAKELKLDLKKAAMIGDKSTDEFTLLNLPTYLLQGQYPIHGTEAAVYTSAESLFRDLPF